MTGSHPREIIVIASSNRYRERAVIRIQPRCRKCGRFITTIQATEIGHCPRCVIVLIERISRDYTRAQWIKATEALRTDALKCIDRGTYLVRSARTEDEYWTGTETCNCPAGTHRRRCYHTCAVRMRELAPVR